MLFSWWRRLRRRRLLAGGFPSAWIQILQQNVRHYLFLDEQEREKLHRCLQIFVAETNWEGCGGLTVTEEMKVTIAGQACLLLLGLEAESFERLTSVLIYPDPYLAAETEVLPGGVVVESSSARLGETWRGGPIVLAWSSVQKGRELSSDGTNVVLHEFAHFLDAQDHLFDGTPPLRDAQQYASWREVMTAEYQCLVRDSQQNRPRLLDDYGATNEAEFFAVATECFFERPRAMVARHPRLYEVLRAFYGQDPAKRGERSTV